MGMAAIGVSLWKYAMKYSPSNPSYFNRDRFVLSNGMLKDARTQRSCANAALQDIPASSNTHSCT